MLNIHVFLLIIVTYLNECIFMESVNLLQLIIMLQIVRVCTSQLQHIQQDKWLYDLTLQVLFGIIKLILI